MKSLEEELVDQYHAFNLALKILSKDVEGTQYWIDLGELCESGIFGLAVVRNYDSDHQDNIHVIEMTAHLAALAKNELISKSSLDMIQLLERKLAKAVEGLNKVNSLLAENYIKELEAIK